MEYRQDNNAIVVLNEENLVGKTAGESTANDLVHAGKLLGRTENCTEDSVHTNQELGTKTRDAVFVPVKGVCHLLLGFWSDDERRLIICS